MRGNVIVLGIALFLFSCTNGNEITSYGEELLQQKCASCHAIPSPHDLSKDLWGQILPRMGARMGMYISPLEKKHYQLLRSTNLLVDQPLMSEKEWDTLQKYIIDNSPTDLPVFKTQISPQPLSWIRAKEITITRDIPAASYVAFQLGSAKVLYGDAEKNRLYEYDMGTETSTYFQLDGAPSDVYRTDNTIQILTMGNIHPNDLNKGRIVSYAGERGESIIDGLSRPVHMTHADLNDDRKTDIIVSGFGYLTGDLAWFEATESGYTKHILRNLPGALKTEVLDIDNDGDTDILALMAQGAEGFFLYLNEGDGTFREKQVLSFPASYGSSYFELRDMNSDGKADIIYTNGDTGDYDRPALKPYHGVRIYLQQDSFTFEEAFYFPMHGPFKAMVEDYDLDGNLDIACISYFPDYNQTPEESFLLLLNDGTNNFNAHSTEGSISGKWLAADRADYDNDGDIDILLGNGPIMSLYVPDSLKVSWQENPLSMMILENTTIDEGN